MQAVGGGTRIGVGELAASQSLGGRARNLTEPEAEMLWLQAERPGCLGSSGAAGFSGPKGT